MNTSHRAGRVGPRKSLLGALALLAVCGPASGALAQEAPEGTAEQRALLQQAQTARAAGRHAEALALAQRAAGEHAPLAARVLVAEEQLALGHAPEAAREILVAQYEMSERPGSTMSPAIEARVRAVLTAANPQVGRVTVRVARSVTEADVRLNGQPLARPFWNVPYPVAPGSFVIEAGGRTTLPERYPMTVNAGQRASVELQLTPAHTPAQPPPTEATPTPQPERPPERGPAEQPRVAMVRSPVGIVIGAIGAAAFFTGVGFGAASNGEYASLQSGRTRCPGPADCDARADRVQTYDTIANVGMIGGGALAVTGAVLFLVIRRPAPQERPPSAEAFAGPSGVGVLGAF